MWKQSVCCQEKTNKQLRSAEFKGFRAKVHYWEPPGILSLLHLRAVPWSAWGKVEFRNYILLVRLNKSITRRLVGKVTVLYEKIVVTLKSGMEMEVEV